MFYLCSECGRVIYVRDGEEGPFICCEKEMVGLEANSEDASLEKHVPYCEIHDGVIDVTVGEVEHPMDEDHYINWVSLVTPDEVKISYLKPGDSPIVSFPFEDKGSVYAYCNKHGLWKKDL